MSGMSADIVEKLLGEINLKPDKRRKAGMGDRLNQSEQIGEQS